MPAFRPLSGITIVSLEQALSAPLATCRLADAGAKVIKIERPEGDFARYYDQAVNGLSTYFVWVNRGKESVRLDFDTDEGRTTLLTIIATADVVVSNLIPGSLEKRGLDGRSLRKTRPDLITCEISGYGPDGPYRNMKAYDNLIQAETGVFDVTGDGDVRSKVGISIADISAGMHAYGAILEAIINRQKTGDGVHIDISMFDGMADWMMVPWLHSEYGAGTPPRSGTSHAAIAPYGVFTTQDGHELLIGLQNEREWIRLCTIVLNGKIDSADERFAGNAMRVKNRHLIDPIIQSIIGSLSYTEAIRRLQEARIAWAHVNKVSDLSDHPQLRLCTVETVNGPIQIAARVARYDGFEDESYRMVE